MVGEGSLAMETQNSPTCEEVAMETEQAATMKQKDETMTEERTTMATADSPSAIARRVTLSPDPEVSNKRSVSDSSESAQQQGTATAYSSPTVNMESASETKQDDDAAVERVAKKARTKPVPLGPLPMPSPEEKEEALQHFKTPADAALQRLAWDLGCRYTLLPHQPEAVRAVAGLPAFFPHRSAHDADTDTMSTNEKFKAFPIKSKTKGILLADEMGLGKTVESIVGMILRNKWHDAHGNRRLPSLIIAPNDTVLRQWHDTLVKAGVSAARIRYYKPRSSAKLEGNFFLLMTRYNVQTEMRALFNKVDMRNKEHPTSPLFPAAPKTLLHKLKNQYQAEKGKAKNNFKHEGESEATCVARLLENFIESQQFDRRPGLLPSSFRTIIVDEAHFLKNLTAFWGIGTALLGINAERMVPLTGTPYNNGNQDLASLMAFIDPAHGASRKAWWDDKTAKGSGPAVIEAIGDWREDYMVLRKKGVVLKGKLPPKNIETMIVSPYMIELFLYEQDEDKFLKVLESFRDLLDDRSPQAKKRLFELFSYAMAHLANMRKGLIHPMLSFGRDVSIRFSPSRAHLLPKLETPKQCVCCKAFKQSKKDQKEEGGEDSKPSAPARTSRRRRSLGDWNMDLDDDDSNDDDEAEEVLNEEDEEESKGPIIPLTGDLCDWSDGPCRHFAHEKCVDAMREDGTTCPVCHQLNSRIHLKQTMINIDGGENNRTGEIGVNHRTYCENILVSPGVQSGFKASAKIERVLAWIQAVPDEEKIIIYSFFKGGLDLLEGVLTYDFGINCARFDGDVDPKVRNEELERFKASPTCRVLLATVQSAGTGLNIVEANNVCFLDRWFNPTVHAQAEDRSHRIGQQRAVNVFFADTAGTADQAMAYVNEAKKKNASIILADGTEFGRVQDGSLDFQELAGMFGNLIRAIRAQRRAGAAENYNAPLQPIPHDVLAAAAAANAKRPARQKQAVKAEKVKSPSEEPTSSHVPATAAAAGASKEQADDVPPQPDHQYETIGGRNMLNLSDSDSDDDDLFDMGPTFKAG